MPALGRATQKVFGNATSINEIGIFGSLAAGSPTYIQSPLSAAKVEQMQSFGNFIQGWYAAVLGNNSPAIQDMNALFCIAFYQLSYLMEAGVPEWDSETTYFTYSIVRGGFSTNGGLFQSLVEDNLNHAVTDTTYWKRIDQSGPTTRQVNGPQTLFAADSGVIFEVDTTNVSNNSFTLPGTIPPGFNFTVKDVAGNFPTNPVTIVRSGSEKIENLAADFLCEAAYGVWEFYFDGTNLWLR